MILNIVVFTGWDSRGQRLTCLHLPVIHLEVASFYYYLIRVVPDIRPFLVSVIRLVGYPISGWQDTEYPVGGILDIRLAGYRISGSSIQKIVDNKSNDNNFFLIRKI